ncbi:MAG TPA: response regulator [Bacteroidia bacterium]|nr:response regulator [Bacteroidia bacterium]
MLSAILIDDQEFCTAMLKDMLEKDSPDVRIAAVCHSGKEGIKAIKKHDPDLVILDVEMPGMTGFDMLREIKEPGFEVIFTTAFDKYSIEAIRFSALDYLLKPIIPHELKAAVEKVEHRQNKNINRQFKTLFKNLQDTRRPVNHVALPALEGLIFVNITDIIHCESDSNYTTLFLKSGEKMMVTKTLKDIEGLLEGNNFFRVHHSHLINMMHIKKYVRGNAGYVVMCNGADINVARNRKEDFLTQFAHL